MRILRGAIAVVIVLAISSCDRGEVSTSSGTSEPARLAAAVRTPAFRNLGKRGDSKL